jgi:uncharacterized damage-inducible protein DinB
MDADLRFPVGKFQRVDNVTDSQRRAFIDAIAETPAKLKAAVAGLSEKQLDTPYRPEGWTVRQVVHHLADSHLNSFTRFKLALTEQEPTIKLYDERLWAELPDSKTPIDLSLPLLEGLHKRWTILLNSLSPSDWQRTFRHPERGTMTLTDNLQLYAWHGRHHVAHITSLRERNGWR